MPEYRLHFLDEAGVTIRTTPLPCEDEATAIRLAAAYLIDCFAELWCDERRLLSLRPTGPVRS